ncbi:MAG TPA: transketolase [Candidatus Methanofastidiosa archaeon]|nr:transketolase [Candidatus Methanofastidiosa archaeon]
MFETAKLIEECNAIRIDSIRMTTGAKSGHPSSCMSCAEILGVLLLDVMNLSPEMAKDPNRDRFVLSKGHAAPAYYSALSRKGFFPRDELFRLRDVGAMLQGHPDMKKTPGVEFSTGSLGMGLSVANGIAMACRLDNTSSNVYVLMGDGELQEGQVWEAAMTSSHYKLSNLVAIVDRNMLQCDGATEDIKMLEPLRDKFASFGWRVFEVDGHNVSELQNIIRAARDVKDAPCVIIARTVKGKGVSSMEGVCSWHGKPLKDTEIKEAIRECNR